MDSSRTITGWIVEGLFISPVSVQTCNMTFIAHMMGVKQRLSLTTHTVCLLHVIQELDFTVYIILMYKTLFHVVCFIFSVLVSSV